MQDENITDNTIDPVTAATTAAGKAVQNDFIRKIVEKIQSSESILIALPRDPSVDGIAAAIGLTVYLDSIQKHATAVYSGRTPDNLAYLQPEVTFEQNTDSLQDFIISLSKEKADHLRYKLEGDDVKVFITPYKTNITEADLSFSHGDYNVDFVIAIDVPSAGNLDQALREHARIMHDASAVNITTGQPGRFGEIEWSNPAASSLCEMVTELIFAIQGSDEAQLDKDVATALLTGIVAATNRFSNERTNPDTLSIASKLMTMGADQRLISSNIDGNEIIQNTDERGVGINAAHASNSKTDLAVEHDTVETPAVPRNPYAEGGPLAGQVGDAMTNPAAQVAPDLDMTTDPIPAGVSGGTNNVNPDSVVVQPVIPGAPAPDASSADSPSDAQPSGITSSEMQIPGMSTPAAQNPAAAAAPETPAESTAPIERQVGVPLQPPAPKAQPAKNYAEMMEAALTEAIPETAPDMPASVPTPEQSAPTTSSTMTLPGIGPAPDLGEAPAMDADSDNPVPPMEPVANPTEQILPPPPVPAPGNGMMPPVLPPVQMPPEQ